MALNTLAIDIGKHSFHLFGIDDAGVIVSRKVSRLKLVATVDRLDPKIIAIMACGSAHHWGRMFQEAGRMVRLINPYFVRPFVRVNGHRSLRDCGLPKFPTLAGWRLLVISR